ncbi:MAG: glutamine-hydrolyzing GMP synthase [Alphaproteobacteria bacterium]|nr:glutamine-hydrolyzing GMP synthase [Alphaproteobacteria bacterium]
MAETILIVDFGSQVTQLIARRLRELKIYCEIHPFNKVNQTLISNIAPKGIILSGGPDSLTQAASPRADEAIFASGLPILGICYGHQLLCQALGGIVESGLEREFGRAALTISDANCSLLDNMPSNSQIWMSHGDRVSKLPDGFVTIAISDNAPYAAIADESRRYYGVQFHPEVAHSLHGITLLENFAHKIAGCAKIWDMANFREQMIAKIQKQAGDHNGQVICGLSGGVDSSVAAILVHQAIGDRLTCIFVDHGLLRAGEAEQVVALFKEHYAINLIHCDEKTRFMGALQGKTDPEEKRKIIGKLFIDVFQEQANKIGETGLSGAKFLVQGTLYPDVIESAPVYGPSQVIKSHHNVGGLPEKMNLKLIEPLRDLFKDEVRALGLTLGLPEAMIARHPFPGPGLAIRIPGEVTAEKCDLLRKIDTIYLNEIKKAGLYDDIWQAFAVLLPVRAVGVMGDARSYEYAASLRAVTSQDGMTADIYPFKPEFLAHLGTKIVNEVKGVNRILYDITSKPPGTIEWE